MREYLKRAVGWQGKSDAKKREIHQMMGILRYRFLNIISIAICLIPIPLRHLLRAAGSDKHRSGKHLYGHTYGNIFRPFKYRGIKLLEIGIGGYGHGLGGESLNAWRAYFPFAKIIGCDIENKAKLATLGTKIYRLDQSSKRDLEGLCAREKCFDIIVDDGSHLNGHQIQTFEVLFPALNNGGIYVIEDVQTSYWKATPAGTYDGANVDDIEFVNTCVGFFLDLTKYINHSEFFDLAVVDEHKLEFAKSIKQVMYEHNLIIVHKGDNTELSNMSWLKSRGARS